MNVKVKICGIRNIEQAGNAIASGADFLGFNFVPTSRRVIDLNVAKNIIEKIKGSIALVGVFQNHSITKVNEICEFLGLNYAQLHGNEDEEFVMQVKVPVIKVFRPKTIFDVHSKVKNMDSRNIFYYLIDREKRGTGAMVDLEVASELARDYSLFFSGGLNPDNVSEVVKLVKPFAVDVASGIETDGDIDIEKLKQFIKNVKEVDL